MRGRAALFIGLAAVLAQEEPQPPPLWRKAQAKMTMDFCSKNPTSELEPCKEPALQESLKGLSLEEKKEKIAAAIGAVELKRKKKIAIIMHDDMKSIYDATCAKEAKQKGEICNNAELKAYLESPYQPPGKQAFQ